MCHDLWEQHTCGHKGAYIHYVHCKYFSNTLDILAKVRTTNLELRMKLNERSCELDHEREELKATSELCQLCKAGLPTKPKSPGIKGESPDAWEALRAGSEVSDLSYSQ